MSEKFIPTTKSERIHSIDLLRGFALLGILIMNIISFSNIGTSYVNPTIGAGLEGYNAYFHAFGYLFAEMRFMSLFSMLFGAGIILFSDNSQRKGITTWKFHYRRMFLLLVFGFIHAYLIWMGDILVAYAICGAIAFLLRKKSNKSLLIWATVFFVIPIFLSISNYFFTPSEILQETFAFYTPSVEETQAEILAYQGSYLQQMEPRISGAIELQTLLFLIEQIWRVLAMMLLGMVLYRKGFFSAQKEQKIYKKWALLGILSGLIVSAIGLYYSYQVEWEGVWIMCIGHNFVYIASLFMALGYIGLINYWSKTNLWQGLKNRLSSVGRMAFTNYILSSIICTFIFYGHGFGYFAEWDRLGQHLVVLGVWIVLLLVSPLVLKRYKQGPLEWLWRKFTYL